MKIKTKKPTLEDAYSFRKKGSYSPVQEYIKPKERIKLAQEFTDSVEKLLKKELPNTKNLILAILKCHLVIEYTLNRFIEFQIIPVVDISKENFTFAQKINLAYMLGLHRDPLLIPSIELINKARNKVAHTLTLETSIIDEAIKINSSNFKNCRISNNNDRIKGLRNVTYFICAYICGAIEAKVDCEKDIKNI